MAKLPVALQLYTVRDDCAKDFPGTLKKVAQIGYNGVELAGLHGMSAPELAKLLKGLGLGVAGMHTGIEALSDNLNGLLADAAALRCPFVICSYLAEQLRKTAEDWRSVAQRLSQIGKQCAQHDVQLCYHNHSFEFIRFDGQYGLDIFYATADRRAVQAELDVFWVKHGGADPVQYVKKYAGRVPLIHLKDMDSTPERAFTELGAGVVDIAGVIGAAEKAGAQWLIVEQDTCKRPPLDSARISLEYLKKIGKA